MSTINADKAIRIYGATGRDIVWAILSTGIDGEHPHFRKHANLELPPPLFHRDFTGAGNEAAMRDEKGNGTHLAGIVAGEMATTESHQLVASVLRYTEMGERLREGEKLNSIAGMAPECKLLSMRVLDEKGRGNTSSIIAALAAIQELNGYGRRLLVHGVLVPVGNSFDPDRFACGLSPVCVEVERLVRSGVVVVVAAGNSGYGVAQTKYTGVMSMGVENSITDPGNAELSITVGSTHRDMPRLYGVSYFSAKGPTLDGRLKPDLVAPGEKIVSCYAKAASIKVAKIPDPESAWNSNNAVRYTEDSGTEIAAAHVAGVIAGFLSVRREYIGKPEIVREIFLQSATDLQRLPSYQGKGLIDAMKALQYDGSSAHQFDMNTRSTDIPPRSVPLPDPVPVPAPPPAPVKDSKHPLRVMCSYSHKDETLWVELKTHLASLRRQGLIEIWYDRGILPGSQWKDEIKKSLEQSDIILLLVSSYFLESDYCYDIEMTRAIERHDAGTAAVVPVIVRPLDWSEAPFGKLQALPRDGKPATSWEDQHAAWQDVALGIRKVVEKLNGPT